MKRLLRLCVAVLLAGSTAAAAKQPNFLVIVADDLGFSDIGAFGGEIETPNLDALARRGLKLTGFHTAPTCSPTRSMLLSGTDNHRAGLGSMAEMMAPNQLGKAGYEGYLSPRVASLAELLAAGGYRTMMSGKWHLGVTPETDPSRRGFQRSFALLQGGHNHFGLGLSSDPAKGYTYRVNGRTLSQLPADFYSSDTFASHLIDFLGEAPKRPDQPFFAYLAFTAPHWPLQAPAETIAKYRGRYDAGYEVLRRQRLARQEALGLLASGTAAHTPVFRHGKPWDQLTPDQQRVQSREMEVYAAMVDRLDQNVGRVVAALKASGDYDNTVILFLADNGAEGLDLASSELPLFKRLIAAADNSIDNIGRPTSFVGYGAGWAQAATAPSWLFKAYTTEGGTRVTAFLSAPPSLVTAGVSGVFGTVMDVVPTLLDLAGLPQPQGRFDGRAVEPIRGRSWAPFLAGRAARVHPADEPVGAELFGSRSLRQGDWKVVRLADGDWQLFDIASDPGETRNLGDAQPKRRDALIAAWETWARATGVILPDGPLYLP